MHIEYEAKAVKIDKDSIREKLKGLNAELIFPEKLYKRAVFKSKVLRANEAWVRVRDEGDKATTTYKQTISNSIDGTKEIEVTVSSFSEMINYLKKIGLSQENYQENYRERWQLGNTVFDIDSWPLIDPFLEIEGDNKNEVKEAFGKLVLNYSKAFFGGVNNIYSSVYGIDILSMPELTFNLPAENT